MYKINDVIVYGKMGACEITDITTKRDANFKKNQLYYVLKPLNESCVIYIPVNTRVFMRPIISAADAERLIDMIPTVDAGAYENLDAKQLARKYEAAIESRDCEELLKLTMSIHAKKEATEKRGRSFGQIDRKYMKQAEDLLFSEIASAVGIPMEKVQDYIASRIEGGGRKSA